MSARLILHIITTLVLFAIGFWLYMRMQENTYDSFDSTNVAIYWFASLVYVLFSWLFYWITHRLQLKAWLIAQILAIVIAAVATVTLLSISRSHQEKLEEKALQNNTDTAGAQGDAVQDSVNGSETSSVDKPETLQLSE